MAGCSDAGAPMQAGQIGLEPTGERSFAFGADGLDEAAHCGAESACRVCPHCECINFTEALACRSCHQDLAAAAPGLERCRSCGAEDLSDARFCRDCGAAMGQGASARLKRSAGWIGLGALAGALVVSALAEGYQGFGRSGPAPAMRPAEAAAPVVKPEVATAAPPPPAERPVLRPARATPGPPPPRRAAPHLRKGADVPVRARAPAGGARIYDPIWVSFPNAEEIGRRYPAAARGKGRNGAAMLDCLIGEDGALRDCRVASETPAGLGFGRAALKLAPLFRAGRANAHGWPAAGYRVRAPVEWSAPASGLF